VVGDPLLRPMRRVVGAVDVQDDVPGAAVTPPRAQVHVEQGVGLRQDSESRVTGTQRVGYPSPFIEVY